MARQKEFDQLATLDKAVMVFWQQGYEKTSMQNLVDQMGIHRRSIYDTYGDKHALFTQALARYQTLADEIYAEAAATEQTISGKLGAILLAGYQHNARYPQGCLLINSATELALVDAAVAKQVAAMFAHSKRALAHLLEQGKQNGEFAPELPTEAVAQFIHNALIGLRVLAKNDTTRHEADAIIRLTLSILH